MGDTKNFPYPVEWEDDQRMNVLFSPFRENRHVNPQSWDSKLKFWSDLLASYCKFTGRIIITPTEVPHMFQRKGRLPQCINKVLEENLRLKNFTTVKEFTSAVPDTWLSWGVNWVLKKPAAWTLNTFVKQPLLWTYSKVLPSNTASGDSLPTMILTDLVCELSKEVLLRQQSQVAHETTDCIVGYNALFQRNADIIKDLDNFHMVLLQLVKDKKCIVFETEKHQKVVRFIKSNKRSITPPNDCDTKIFKLTTTETTLQDQICKLEAEVLKLQDEAKAHIKSGFKTKAKNSLRRKRQVEAIRMQKEAALANIQQLIRVIQQADTNQMVLDAYSSGNEVFKQLSKQYGLTPDKVDDIMTDLEQTFEMQQDLNHSLVADTSVTEDFSMDELEDELAQILLDDEKTGHKQSDDVDSMLPGISDSGDSTPYLPDVPTFDPSSPVAGHSKDLSWGASKAKPPLLGANTLSTVVCTDESYFITSS